MTSARVTGPTTWEHADIESQVDRRYGELHRALVDATDLDQLPAAQPLIDEILYRDSLNWLHGKPGHGKSFVALDWACHVATGRHWRDHETLSGRVLYIVAEGAHGMDNRRRAWETANQHDLPNGVLLFLPVAVQLLKDLDVTALEQLATLLAPELIIIDTQARVTVGADENSAKDMGLLVDHLDRLRIATRACILLVHHESRAGDTLRGSTALEGAATTVIRATKDGSVIRLDNTKQKDGPQFDPILGRLTTVELPTGQTSAVYSHRGVGVSDIATESEQKLLEVVRESFGTTGASASVLLAATNLSSSTFYRALNALVTKGLIHNAGSKTRTLYVLTETDPLT